MGNKALKLENIREYSIILVMLVALLVAGIYLAVPRERVVKSQLANTTDSSLTVRQFGDVYYRPFMALVKTAASQGICIVDSSEANLVSISKLPTVDASTFDEAFFGTEPIAIFEKLNLEEMGEEIFMVSKSPYGIRLKIMTHSSGKRYVRLPYETLIGLLSLSKHGLPAP